MIHITRAHHPECATKAQSTRNRADKHAASTSKRAPSNAHALALCTRRRGAVARRRYHVNVGVG
eukprot:4274643-Pleurochrysis_carterae.AAC.1